MRTFTYEELMEMTKEELDTLTPEEEKAHHYLFDYEQQIQRGFQRVFEDPTFLDAYQGTNDNHKVQEASHLAMVSSEFYYEYLTHSKLNIHLAQKLPVVKEEVLNGERLDSIAQWIEDTFYYLDLGLKATEPYNETAPKRITELMLRNEIMVGEFTTVKYLMSELNFWLNMKNDRVHELKKLLDEQRIKLQSPVNNKVKTKDEVEL